MKLILLLILNSCVSLLFSQQNSSTVLDVYLDSLYATNPELVGMIVSIRRRDGDILFDNAYGYRSMEKKVKLSPADPLLIASMTKSYVAAAIIKLAENEKLELNHSISMYLGADSSFELEGAGYSPDRIKIRHLLSHRSGISDYVDSSYFAFAKKNPKYRWCRDEQIEKAMMARNSEDTLGLGEFRYGDINYLLLAEIIENIYGKTYNEAIAELLGFDILGIDSTWFPTIDEGPSLLAIQYSSKDSINSGMFDPSWDLYGGGGLAATARDVSQFLSHLFNGNIISDSVLLSEMVSPPNPKSSNYALGFRVIKIPKATLYYHGGYWGTDMFYSPESGISVAIFLLNKDYQDSLGPRIGMKVLELFGERGE